MHRPADVELDAGFGEFLDDVAGIGQRAGQPVELGDDEGVAGSAGGQRLAQTGSCPVGAGQAVVDLDLIRLHFKRGQRVALDSEVLLIGRAAGPTSILATRGLERLGHPHQAFLRAGLMGFWRSGS